MNVPNIDIEKAVKKALENTKVTYRTKAWTRLEQDLPRAKFPLWAKIGLVASVTLLTLSVWIFTSHKSDNSTIESEKMAQEQPKPATHLAINHQEPLSVKNSKEKVTNKETRPIVSEPIITQPTNQPTTQSANQPLRTNETILADILPTQKEYHQDSLFLSPQIILSSLSGCTPLNISYSVEGLPRNSMVEWSLLSGNQLKKIDNQIIIEHKGFDSLLVEIVCEGYETYKQIYATEVWALPKAAFDYQMMEDDKLSFKLANTRIKQAEWYLNGAFISDELQDEYLIEMSGKYELSLRVEDDKGCVNKHIANFKHHIDHKVFAPTAFSPNGDGNNDVFFVKYLSKPHFKYTFQIYSLSGNLLFETQQPNEGWEGESNAINGQYYLWRLVIQDAKGNTELKQGRFKQL